MTDADDDDETTPPPPRARFRRARALAKWTFGFLAVIALLLFVGRLQMGRIGQRQLSATTQQVDAEDPGWRLDALLGAREAQRPAPAEDATPLVLEIAADVPREWNDWQTALAETDWSRPHPDNHRPSAAAMAAAEPPAERTHALRTRALQLRDRKSGVYPLVVPADPIATLLPHIDRARKVVALLGHDGRWETLQGDPNRGIAAARATLGVARSIGDEPFLISQLVRMACAKAAADTALQVLAWGEPTDGLRELQAELLAEADVPWFRYGMRGERAVLDRVFQGLEDGTIPPENAFRYADIGEFGPHHLAAFRAYKAFLPGDRAKCLQLCTELVEASNLPPHEQLAAVRKVEIPGRPPEEFRYVLTRLLLPACQRVAETGLRVRAELLAAGAAVACERFRRKTGHFPHDLAELVPEFLPAVPLNPFDAAPFRYRVYPDRVAVLCVWPNSPPRIETQPEELRDALGLGLGYRLWEPRRRGLPAEEPKDP